MAVTYPRATRNAIKSAKQVFMASARAALQQTLSDEPTENNLQNPPGVKMKASLLHYATILMGNYQNMRFIIQQRLLEPCFKLFPPFALKPLDWKFFELRNF